MSHEEWSTSSCAKVFKNLPPGGGDGTGSNPCDDWPELPDGTDVDPQNCPCPPDATTYDNKRFSQWLNLVPFFGQIVIQQQGMPKNCQDQFDQSAKAYNEQQTALQAAWTQGGQDFENVVETLNDLYDGETKQGIIPTTINAALAPGVHAAFYLLVVMIGTFLVVAGVVFTI